MYYDYLEVTHEQVTTTLSHDRYKEPFRGIIVLQIPHPTGFILIVKEMLCCKREGTFTCSFSFNLVQLRECLWACRCGRQTRQAWSSPSTPRCQGSCLCSSDHLLRGGWSSECAPPSGPIPELTASKQTKSSWKCFAEKFLNHKLILVLRRMWLFVLLTGSLDTSTDWQMSGALTS